MRIERQAFKQAGTPVTISAQDSLNQLRSREHPECVVCGNANGHGLGLDFLVPEPGVVQGMLDCQPEMQGYPGVLHGGAACALLDGAMINCLFALGHIAVTADLKVRFRHPIRIGRLATVHAHLESSLSVLHVLKAEIRQDGRVAATAVGKFVEKSFAGWPKERTPGCPEYVRRE